MDKKKNKTYICVRDCYTDKKTSQKGIQIYFVNKKNIVPYSIGGLFYNVYYTQGIESEVWHYLIREGLEKAPKNYSTSDYYDYTAHSFDIKELEGYFRL